MFEDWPVASGGRRSEVVLACDVLLNHPRIGASKVYPVEHYPKGRGDETGREGVYEYMIERGTVNMDLRCLL